MASKSDIIFEPNPGPQTDFLASSEREVLYGGAAGGGKSYAMVVDPLRYAHNPNARMLLVRKSTEELRELISISQKLYKQAVPGAEWKERDKTWYFPEGGSLWLSYLDRDEDVTRYQGQAFNWIGFDELTQWSTPYAWNYMRSRLRSTDPELRQELCMRATSNPGGPGHHWVKKMFVDPSAANTPFWATNIETGEILRRPKGHSLGESPLFKRRFIPATLFDNPYLSDDGEYEANLLSMSEKDRRQLLEGDWSIVDGAAFPEFSEKVHTIAPFEIPYDWPRFRACDYGYGSHSGILWFAVSPKTEQLVVYREMYVSKVTAENLADMILDAEKFDKIRYGVLDSSLWHKRGDTGPSLAEKMIMKGCRWRPSDRSKGSRVAGKNELHRRLQIDEFSEEPRLIIFNTCRHLINQIPALPLDKNNPEDVDTKSEDHLYDALRYGIMSRPRTGIFDMGFGNPGDRYKAADPIMGY